MNWNTDMWAIYGKYIIGTSISTVLGMLGWATKRLLDFIGVQRLHGERLDAIETAQEILKNDNTSIQNQHQELTQQLTELKQESIRVKEALVGYDGKSGILALVQDIKDKLDN